VLFDSKLESRSALFRGLGFPSEAADTCVVSLQAGRLHCLLPRWPDAMMSFMSSGGYSLTARIPKVGVESPPASLPLFDLLC
jgi:hypothetical protein